MWSAYLARSWERDGVVDWYDVCALNILQKVARIAGGSAGEDTWVDIIGYVLNVEMMRVSPVSRPIPARNCPTGHVSVTDYRRDDHENEHICTEA